MRLPPSNLRRLAPPRHARGYLLAILLLIPSLSRAHGNPAYYLIDYGYPWVLTIFGISGLVAFWNAKTTKQWNAGRRCLVGFGLGVEVLTLLFASPFRYSTIPLVVGPFQLISVLAYAGALLMLAANVALFTVPRPRFKHVVYFVFGAGISFAIAANKLIERQTAYHLNPGPKGARAWQHPTAR